MSYERGLASRTITSSFTRAGLAVRTRIRSAKNIASSTSCVTKTTVFFVFSRIPTSNSCINVRVCASSDPNGSSMRITEGSFASALAKPTRCCIPPESSLGKRVSKPDRPTSFTSRSAIDLLAAFPSPFIFGPNSTLPMTVFHGNKLCCWKTMPRFGEGPVIGSDPQYTSPADGRTNPAMAFRIVDFPHPDVPRKHTNSPGWTSKFRP